MNIKKIIKVMIMLSFVNIPNTTVWGQSSGLSIYSVTNTTNWIVSNNKRINLLDKNIDGITNYIRWAQIEPSEGKFDWVGLDRMAKEANDNNKKMSYNILAGAHAPPWLYKYTKPYPYHFHDRANTTYLPWVETKTGRKLNYVVLNKWKSTVNGLASYIYSKGYQKNISYIAITGGPTGNGLEVMWAQDNYAEMRDLNFDREADKLFIDFWKNVIDIYLEAFPDIPLGIAFADYFGLEKNGKIRRNYSIPKEIVNYALARAELKNTKIIPMALWIGTINPLSYNNSEAIKLLDSFGTDVALQGEIKTKSRQQLEQILNLAIRKKAAWIELWDNDILNGDYDETIKNNRKKNHDSLKRKNKRAN